MCPFCAIVAGTAPAGIVAESGRALAFMDLRQPLPAPVVGLGRNGAEYSVPILTCLLAHAWAYRPQAFRMSRGPR